MHGMCSEHTKKEKGKQARKKKKTQVTKKLKGMEVTGEESEGGAQEKAEDVPDYTTHNEINAVVPPSEDL